MIEYILFASRHEFMWSFSIGLHEVHVGNTNIRGDEIELILESHAAHHVRPATYGCTSGSSTK